MIKENPLYPQGSSSAAMNVQQTGDYHFRQESTDSGLGMPPFGYSHTHTPENFLSSDIPPLNIAGIDLNFNVPTPMEMDTISVIINYFLLINFNFSQTL